MTETNLGRIIGPEGPAGKSAYQYAQEGGFEGSEQEFAEKLATEYPTFSNLRAAAPVNLLDNSDFRNPVNQRSVTSWNYIGYGIDRWFTNGASANISVTSNGLQGSANFLVQKFEKTKLNGASKVTAAVKVDGAIYSGVLDISSFNVGADVIVISNIPGMTRINLFNEDNNICQFYFAGLNSVTIEWAALYVGEYTAETLPEYNPKGYGAELAECLRYFQTFNSRVRNLPGLGATIAYPMNFRVPMRIKPTVTNVISDETVRVGEDSATKSGFSIYVTAEFSNDITLYAQFSADL